MARRPNAEEFDKPLTREELERERRKLALLSPYHVAAEYRAAYDACKMEGESLPRARSVQTLVIAWKLMWTWKRRRPRGRD